GFYLTTTDELSKSSSLRLLSWGTVSNGKCLTAKILVCPRTESASSLSDILELNPHPKYFLSEQLTAASLIPGQVTNTLTACYEAASGTGTYVAEGELNAQVKQLVAIRTERTPKQKKYDG